MMEFNWKSDDFSINAEFVARRAAHGLMLTIKVGQEEEQMASLKKSLLLLPGLICDRRIWSAQIEAFSDHEVIAFDDYRGCNRFEQMAARALEAAPRTFCLAGHSMGARVALEVWRAAPERVEKLALLDTGVHSVKPGEKEKRYALRDLGREKGIDALIDEWLPPMVHPDRRQDENLMHSLREMCSDCGMERFENDIEALLHRPAVESLLNRIQCPTLVAVGRQDEWSTVEQHEKIVASLSNATFRIFEDCGHMAPAEAPDAVNMVFREWLSH